MSEKEKHAGGRPPKFESVEELEECIEKYKQYLLDEDKPPTMAGLAYYTGIDRKTLFNYNKKDEFFPTIKNFVDFVKMTYEETAINNSSSGIIFLMKNYGYVDKTEQDITTQGDKITNQIDYSKLSTEAIKELRNATTSN